MGLYEVLYSIRFTDVKAEKVKMAIAGSNTRTENGKRNIAAAMLNRVILIVLPFAARSVMLMTLGKSYLGLGSLFTSILMVLNLSELGFGSALVYSMYKPVADNDVKKINALLNLYRKIYRIIGVGVLIIGLCLVPFLPYIIKDGYPSDINIYILFVVYLINASVSYFLFAYKRALLTAYQKVSVISNINTVLTIVTNAAQILILITIKNYYAYVIVYPLISITQNLIIARITNKVYPNLECDGNVSKEEKDAIKKHVKGIALQKFCSTSRNSFDSIVISMYLGLVSIGIYNNYFLIISSIHAFLYQIPNAIRASVGNSIALESVEKNFNDFKKFSFIYFWVSAWFCVCLLCLFQPFMKLWMGQDMLLPFSSVILFCIYFLELCMSDIISLYKDAAGLWWHGRYRTVIEAVANLILNFVLGRFWGINGIIFASVITMLLIGFGYGGYIVFHHYFSSFSIKRYFLTLFGFVLTTSTACAATYYLCMLIPLEGVLLVSCRTVVCLILPNALMWFIYHRTTIFKSSLAFAIKVVKKK